MNCTVCHNLPEPAAHCLHCNRTGKEPPKYRLIGKSICIGPNDWPPMLKDNSARPGTLELIVEALNFYHENFHQEHKLGDL